MPGEEDYIKNGNFHIYNIDVNDAKSDVEKHHVGIVKNAFKVPGHKVTKIQYVVNPTLKQEFEV